MNLQEADDTADKILRTILGVIHKAAKAAGGPAGETPEEVIETLSEGDRLLGRMVIQQCAGVLSNDAEFIALGMWARGEHE